MIFGMTLILMTLCFLVSRGTETKTGRIVFYVCPEPTCDVNGH